MKLQMRGSAQLIMGVLTLSIIAVLILSIFSTRNAQAASAREIDVSVEIALEKFYENVKGAKEFVKISKGMLVMPNVVKAGFIVGGEYGEGALRIGKKTAAYYSIAAGSFGLQIGAQKKDIIIAFMTDKALKSFREGSGWEAGVDGNIALIDVGGGKRLDTTTIKDPIVAFVFDVKGLMADISFKGSKFTKLKK